MSTGPIAYIVSMREGLEAFVYRELEFLEAAGEDFVLFAPRAKRGDKFSPKEHWPSYSPELWLMCLVLPWHLLRLAFKPKVLLHALKHKALVDAIFASYFAGRMKKHGVEQIHSHFGDHKLFIGYYCHRLSGLPLSVTVHAHEFYTNPNELLFPVALQACARVFTIANKWKRLLVEDYGLPEEKVSVIHLFVDPELYRPKSTLTVLAVGRFTERKGFGILLEAAQTLAAEQVDFVFVGFGPLDIRAMAKELGIESSVTVFDKLDQAQLRILYRSADVFCLPSITTQSEGAEGIPVVLMEAMATGLPVVATRCGATEELVSEGLIDEESVTQIIDSIRALAQDAEQRAAQGARNREIVRRDFSPGNPAQFLGELTQLRHPAR